jgi:uracil-DNA glycosylase
MSQALPLIATYHPAFLLRSPQYKKDARADLDRIRAFLDGSS